jgi:hypothetical protein
LTIKSRGSFSSSKHSSEKKRRKSFNHQRFLIKKAGVAREPFLLDWQAVGKEALECLLAQIPFSFYPELINIPRLQLSLFSFASPLASG